MKKLLVIALIVVAAIVTYFVVTMSMDDIDGLGGDPWTLVLLEDNGKKEKMEDVGIKVQFTKKAVIWTVPTREGVKDMKGEYVIDPSKKPRQIDLTSPLFDLQAGIYDLKSDGLIICLGPRRPTEFSSRGQVVMVFKRG